MSELKQKHCVPCKGGVPPIKGEALQTLQSELSGNWDLIDEHHLQKEFRFKSYRRGRSLFRFSRDSAGMGPKEKRSTNSGSSITHRFMSVILRFSRPGPDTVELRSASNYLSIPTMPWNCGKSFSPKARRKASSRAASLRVTRPVLRRDSLSMAMNFPGNTT